MPHMNPPSAPYRIERFTPDHAQWSALADHLDRCGMHRWIVDDQGSPLPDVWMLGALLTSTEASGAASDTTGGATGEERSGPGAPRVVGHIAVQVQQVIIPPSELSRGQPVPLANPFDEGKRPLLETYVMTFAVDDDYRRQGIGSALQCAALELTRELGGYQMRSWSSVDKTANYALKLRLGFAAHPAIQTAYNGNAVSGVYFVKLV